MYVIDPSGKLIYAGAIDDHPTTDASDIPHSKNYVSDALTEAMAGTAGGRHLHSPLRLQRQIQRRRLVPVRAKS